MLNNSVKQSPQDCGTEILGNLYIMFIFDFHTHAARLSQQAACPWISTKFRVGSHPTVLFPRCVPWGNISQLWGSPDPESISQEARAALVWEQTATCTAWAQHPPQQSCRQRCNSAPVLSITITMASKARLFFSSCRRISDPKYPCFHL